MRKHFMRKISVAVLSAAMVLSFSPALAEDAAQESYIHFAAYYDGSGALLDAKCIKGALSDDELDALVNIYEPETAASAKVFEWTEDLEPLNDVKEIDVADAERSAVILHTNDMHGALVGSSSAIGSDSVAALKKLDDAVLADSGDATQGLALASQSKGEDVIKIMNAAGYDVMALGNHEFDFGLDQLSKLRGMADFPIISANTYAGGKPLCASDSNNGENVIIDKNGIKIGIFALTTRDTEASTKPENLVGIEFKDEVETAKAQTDYLDKQGADVIIALAHMGVTDQGYCTSDKLAEAMQGTELDAIIDGHSHTVMNDKVGGITIAQTGTGSVNVGRMEIELDASNNVTINETMLSRAFFDNITPDPDTTKTITDVSAELNETLSEVIGVNQNTLWGGGLVNTSGGTSITESRVGETNFGNLICGAMIAEAENIAPDEYRDSSGKVSEPIVAIENGGGFRVSVPNGEFTIGSIIDALPFSNTVRIKEITPAILYKALEGYLSSVTAQDKDTGFLTASYSGSFPQIGGMSVSYDPNKPEGEKITGIKLAGGAELDKNDGETKLILASNDYVIEQGEFKDIPLIAEGSGLTEAVIDYINTLTNNGEKPLAVPTTSGRITAGGDYSPKNYTAHITLLNADGLKDGDTVKFYIDGAEYPDAGVVNGGVLDITIPDGPHAVKLYPDQHEVYVNNYSGNGVLDVYGTLKLGYPQLEYRK